MSADQIILRSVGSFIQTDGVTGPLLSNGLPDIFTPGSEGHINDPQPFGEWHQRLSEEDLDTVHAVKCELGSDEIGAYHASFGKPKWTQCGLNADWSFDAWHYGHSTPNTVDGEHYVLDMEDDTFAVVQYFPSYEEDCVLRIKNGFTSLDIAKKFVEVMK